MEEAPKRILSFRSGKSFNVKKTAEKRVAQFPSTWFNTEGNDKPKLIIPKSNMDLKTLRASAQLFMSGAKVHIDIILEYIFVVLSNVVEENSHRWGSYGVAIAGEKGKINPFCMFLVSRTESRATDAVVSKEALNESVDIWLCLYILSVYRIEKITEQKYKNDTIKKMCDHVIMLGGTTFNQYTEAAVKNRSWANSPDFRKLIAGLDMFFHRFEANDFSILRFATIGSRFRDCAALQVYSYVSELCGFTEPGDLLHWVFNETLAEEAEAMFNNNEEYDDNESYFPYHIDMGLVARSAYSSRVSPGMHFFCNLVGALLGSERCLNARALLDKDIPGITNNAKWVGFIFMKSPELRTFFADDTEEGRQLKAQQEEALRRRMEERAAQFMEIAEGDKSEGEPEEVDLEEVSWQPIGRNPAQWIDYITIQHGEPNATMKATFRDMQAGIKNPRPGSIAEFITKPIFHS
ncbi:putative nucleoprotein [Hubei diptera virus 10]|uniref:Nucleoprotein n=1 Tax=Hubei diptera virus 10 TaxID=1922871 RepID=A0A1L3KMW0_9RHAB|nr:putative nucleoprotein [Hubei diptera virus 10]APG78751.1 putative nucleoprotein [Hubei diptera virus 10]